MTNTKINLIITLPGGEMMSEQECSEKNLYKHLNMDVQDSTGKRETIHVKLRQCKPVKKVLNISQETYDFWMSPQGRQRDMSADFWNRMPKDKRLEIKIKNLVEYYGGVAYSYTVFED